MTELGYDRFLFSGSDLGAGVGLGLVRNYPDRLLGAHFVNVYSQYPRPDDPTTEEQEYFRRVDAFTFAEAAYAMQQSTKPTTLAVGLNDSPTGLASWIVEKFHSSGRHPRRRRERFSARHALLDPLGLPGSRRRSPRP